MFCHEGVEPVLSTADGYHEAAALDHALGEGLAYSRGGACYEDGLVGERHLDRDFAIVYCAIAVVGGLRVDSDD